MSRYSRNFKTVDQYRYHVIRIWKDGKKAGKREIAAWYDKYADACKEAKFLNTHDFWGNNYEVVENRG